MKITLETELCRMFSIRYPIFLAGMAGGPGTIDLAVAISNAGGLGTIGAAYLEPEVIRNQITEIRKLTNMPFAVNLFVTDSIDDWSRIEEVQRELNHFRNELGLETSLLTEKVSTPNYFREQYEVLIEERVPVISTAFGILPNDLVRRAKSNGIRLIAMVTSVNEALVAEEAGYDAIVAQGSEAGGHRGTFDMNPHPKGINIGTMALVPQIVDHVSIPVIAAGGIMDGRGLVASLVLGADGVQLGTRFLASFESGAHMSYKQRLLESNEETTKLTKAFSGRPARGIKNAFMMRWDESGIEPLAFPTQNTITRDIRNAASNQNNPEFMSLWAGQGLRMLSKHESAEEIFKEIIAQAKSILSV